MDINVWRIWIEERHPLHRVATKQKGRPCLISLSADLSKTPHRSVDFRLSHRSSHQSPTAANTPPIRYYHSVMSIIALIHHHRSLPPSLPSLSLTCQKWWRERSVSRGLPSPGRAPARSDDLIRLSGHERHASPRLAHHTVYVSCQLSVSSIVAGRWLSGAIAIRAYKPSSS